MELIPGSCFLVGSGDLGFGLTEPWDAHAYLVRSDAEALLIDSGCGRNPQLIVAAIERYLNGLPLKAIALTHAHIDHAGGATYISDFFGCPVFASTVAAERLRVGDEQSTGLADARREGVFPPDLTLEPIASIRVVPARLSVGDLAIRVVPTPGHSVDHVSYVIDFEAGSALFSGDLVFAQGRVVIHEQADSDAAAYQRSLRELSSIRPTMLFPGHGAISLSRGWAHVDAALAAFDEGRQPTGFLS